MPKNTCHLRRNVCINMHRCLLSVYLYPYTVCLTYTCKHTLCMVYLFPPGDQGPKNVKDLDFAEVQCICNLVSVADLKGIS